MALGSSLYPRLGGLGLKQLPRATANVNACKNMYDPYIQCPKIIWTWAFSIVNILPREVMRFKPLNTVTIFPRILNSLVQSKKIKNTRSKSFFAGCCCCCVRVLRPTNSYGHTETGPRFKVSSERLEKPGIELTTPGLQSG